MAGSYGSAYTRGLQQYTGTEKVVQSVVTLKHYFAYSIESYSQPGTTDPAQMGVSRQNVDVRISAYDLAHTYFPAWEKTVGSCEDCGHALVKLPFGWPVDTSHSSSPKSCPHDNFPLVSRSATNALTSRSIRA